MQFSFPTEPDEVSSFISFEQAKNKITALLKFQNLQAYCQYRFQLIRTLYIYCCCRYCSARLIYKKIDNRFQLIKSNAMHQHRKVFTNKANIIEAIREYPSCFNTQTIKQQIKNRFNISNATFYRRFREALCFGDSLDQILIQLEDQGIFGICIKDQNQELPSLLMLTSELMREKYYINDKNVKFDLTYNLVRQKTVQEQQYAVGVFVSLNNNFNIQPHCLVIMENESKLSFVRMFTQFFMLMRQPPNIIMTDEQKNIELSLSELKQRSLFHGYHFIDVFHVLRNAKKALFHKPFINYLVSLSRSEHIVEYHHRRQACYQKFTERDRKVLFRFQQKAERCCVALLPQVFIGLSCTTSSSQKINDMIKQKLPHSQKYVLVVSQLARLLDIEQFTMIEQIKELRAKLSKRIFRKLMIELSFCMTCLVSQTEDLNNYSVMEQNFENETFIVQFLPEGKWKCECSMSQKIGIPCSHILKIILFKKQRISSAINKWWFFDQKQFVKQKKALDYPRKTRRHRR